LRGERKPRVGKERLGIFLRGGGKINGEETTSCQHEDLEVGSSTRRRRKEEIGTQTFEGNIGVAYQKAEQGSPKKIKKKMTDS